MSDVEIDREKLIEELREKSDDPEILGNLIKDLNDDSDIGKPDTSDLYNEVNSRKNLPTNEEKVKLNGEWVHLLFLKISNLMARGYSPIIIIVGKEGRGKSYAAQYLAYRLHDLDICRGEYNPMNQVLYDVKEFLFFIRENTRKTPVMEEANETLNALNYHSEFNKSVAGAIRTQRKRQIPYIFVAPEFKKLDSRIRDKVDVLIDFTGKRKARITTYDYKHGKRGSRGLDYSYTDYPDWYVPEPPGDVIKQYEKIDDRFKGDYLDEMLKKVLKEEKQRLEEEDTRVI